MKKILILIGILLLPICVKADTKDMYFGIYKEVKKSKNEVPTERAADQLLISSDELLAILNNTDKIQKVCNKLDQSDLTACYDDAKILYLFEKGISEMESTEKLKALATEIWSNGTLEDSEFDLVVDLNIIDVLYFGPEAKIPTSRLYNPFDNKDDNDENPEIDPETGEVITEPVDLPTYEFIDETTESDDSNDEDSSDENIEDGEDFSEFVCRDPDALFFNPTNNKDDNSVSPDSNDKNNTSKSTTKTSLREGILSGADNNYLGSYYPSFDDEGIADDANKCDGEEVEMFGNIFCVPKFCDQVLCIDIEFIAGTPNRNSLNFQDSANCVSCLINYMDLELEDAYKVKDRLAPEGISTKHWWSRIWKFGDNFIFNINVINKSGTVAERITREKDMTLVEEYRYAVASSIQQGSAAFVATNGSVSENVDNRKLLTSIIGDNCASYLNMQLGGSNLDKIAKECENNLTYSSSPLLQDQTKNQDFLINTLVADEQKRKIQRWQEIVQGFEMFVDKAITINKGIRLFPSKFTLDSTAEKRCEEHTH